MTVSTTPAVSTPPRVVRPLRNIDMTAIRAISDTEQLPIADTIRLMFSYATYKWPGAWTGDLGPDTHSVKLLPGGIEAVRILSEREITSWDAMASQLLTYAVDQWKPGWRKDQPGPLGAAGVHQGSL